MQMLPDLFLTFFRIGLFSFGGGYAMIPVIEHLCVDRKAWITHDEMMDITAIAESTPGPIAVNCATYVGLKKKGVPGALAATFGVILPSFVILLLISFFFDRMLEVKWVASAFRGIRSAVGVLLIAAAARMIGKMQKRALPILLFAGAFAAMLLVDLFALHVSTIVLMAFAAAVGLIAYRIRRHTGGEAEK